jgi:hypothetical protein
MFSVNRVKVRRRMVNDLHPDGDAVKPRDRRHTGSP